MRDDARHSDASPVARLHTCPLLRKHLWQEPAAAKLEDTIVLHYDILIFVPVAPTALALALMQTEY